MIAAVVVGVFGIGLTWWGGSPFDENCLDFRGANEGASLSIDTQLWPPATWRCEFATTEGSTFTRSEFPAFTYLMWLYLAAAVGLCAWALGSRSSRTVATAGLGLVLVAGGATLAFIHPAVSFAVGLVLGLGWWRLARRPSGGEQQLT